MGDIGRKHEIDVPQQSIYVCDLCICNLSIYVQLYARMTNVCTCKESHIHMLNVE